MDSHIENFLSSTPWHDAKANWFPADWSTRRYARLTNPNGETAMLMASPPDDSPLIHAGHKTGEWVRINMHLRDIGLHAPHIYAHNLTSSAGNALVLMEDFGIQTIADKGIEPYMAAVDTLITLRDHPKAADIELLSYTDTHVYAALRFFPEYILGDVSQADRWFAAWQSVMSALPPCPQIFTHIDYFAGNLMWMPQYDGVQSIGILDFQAACIGPFVYDMVNLLDDIRRDIPLDIKRQCINRYCAALSPDDRHAFDQWYIVMAAQFHARILGQIIKLKTVNGRDDLMQYFDNLLVRFKKELQAPPLAPILRLIEQTSKNKDLKHG